ncbi:hypothetical protein DFP78_106307 [Photobacterium lutimaris]|nr:hypothetical protein DFP78_106307 [Photobacterium lutimaris]
MSPQCNSKLFPFIKCALFEVESELTQKALELEADAELETIKGVGRRFNWAEFLSQPDLVGNFPAD